MMTRTCTVLLSLQLIATAAAAQNGPPFELAARRDQFIGGPRGTLVVGQDAIEFRSADSDTSRRWEYSAIKEVRVLSRASITLDTYEDRGRLHFGTDRTYTFEMAKIIPESLVAFLLTRVTRPIVTVVMPPLPATARFQVAVKHDRAGRGSDGTLRLYGDAIAYLADRENDARYWRLRDVVSVLSLDEYRLELSVYEGGSGKTRPFTFELKEPLPPGMYDALWYAINGPARAGHE